MPGKLLVVATPIGNLEDLSPRALAALREADCIACEDTRRTARLRARFDLTTPTVSFHRFNERQRLEPLLERLRSGATVALVSDGGTPGISDPGARLVAAALDQEIEVRPVPGPSAGIALLSASGFPAERHVFEGFLPSRTGERRRRLRSLRTEERPVVLFEAPHRIRQTLDDIHEVLGERMLLLGRELTKRYETILRGTAAELLRKLAPEVRGEITLIVGPAGSAASDSTDRAARELVAGWKSALSIERGDRRAALRRLARETGVGRAELYRRLTELGVAEEGPGSSARRRVDREKPD